MLPANSLEDIVAALEESLGEITEYVPRFSVSTDVGLLIPGGPPDAAFDWDEVTRVQWSKIVGVLFCSPTSKLGRDEVVPHLDYFHHRSALFVDFFCVGYGAHWPASHMPGEARIVAEVDGTQWVFSPQHFNATRAQLERAARWQYSGETDLLLAVARQPSAGSARLDFSTAIACNLEAMVRDEAITSARAFFEQIFRFGEAYDGADPVHLLSDRMGLKAGGNFLLEAVLTLVPEAVRKGYRQARHFAVSDVSRPAVA